MAPKATPQKDKYTRNQSIRRLAAGEDPEQFKAHANYHVRRYAWVKMGRPLPESEADRDRFLATLKLTADKLS